MLNPQSAVYLGEAKEGGFSHTVVEDNLYLSFEIEEGMDDEQGKQFIEKIKIEIKSCSIENLSSFDRFISNLITKHNVPTSISLAAGYRKEKILYLKTVGSGLIFLKRQANLAQIIDKDNSASGFLELEDLFIFTTNHFLNLIGSDGELKSVTDNNDPRGIVHELALKLKEKNNQGVTALFLQFTESTHLQNIESKIPPMAVEKKNILNEIIKNSKDLFMAFRARSAESGKKKVFTLVAVIVVFLFLVWSIGLGVIRRKNAEVEKKIQTTKELISLKLNQAGEVAFLNLPRSITLIEESKQELEKLKSHVGKSSEKDIKELEGIIKSQEGKIVKKEEKNFEEFFDLTVDSKDARGSKSYLEEDVFSILSNDKKTIYSLSLIKKSLDKKNASQSSSANLLATYEDTIIFYVPGEGIFKVGPDNKSSKVIEDDKDWGKIVTMWIYNGNLYLLDSAKGDIYKYLVTSDGYSSKNSYLKGNAGIIKNSNSLAIDSSIYVGFENIVMKFTSGSKDGFSTSWPEKNVSLYKIFTSPDVTKVYGWDKKNGVIYILNKNGTYERQIKSGILMKADDFAVYGKDAYILMKEKIYKINLE